MGKGLKVEIVCIQSVDSTHTFMCDKIRNKEIDKELAIYALNQNNGVGSRDNEWQSKPGNLHLNFCLKQSSLVADLPLNSISIYFGFLMKSVLNKNSSKVWLKWPNDIYLDDKKVGGLISAKIDDFIVVGIGLNLKYAPPYATVLDIDIGLEDLIQEYLKEIEKKISWKLIFRNYIVEFEKSRAYKVHLQGKEYSLQEASLYEDGSILLENKRMYNLR